MLSWLSDEDRMIIFWSQLDQLVWGISSSFELDQLSDSWSLKITSK